jgi:CCR4-NOT transcription complex subunit 1
MRILLVLLHDLPEFLADYHAYLVPVLPKSAVQMRNLILSAFPKTLKLPDPFQPGLVMRFLPEAKFPVRLLFPFAESVGAVEPLARAALRGGREASEVWPRLAKAVAGVIRSNVGVEELVYCLSVTWPTAEKIKAAVGDSPATPTSALEMVTELSGRWLDSECRYEWISAISCFLRYPSSQTVFFSELLLGMFLWAKGDDFRPLRECILRVLLERLIVHRPHPWGLLVTFATLVRDPAFWDAVGTSMNPDVEKIFNTVAATCVGSPPNNLRTPINS